MLILFILLQLPFDVSESVQQYPDMYRSIMRTMALAKVINLFLKIMYNDDSFMSADLFDPSEYFPCLDEVSVSC